MNLDPTPSSPASGWAAYQPGLAAPASPVAQAGSSRQAAPPPANLASAPPSPVGGGPKRTWIPLLPPPSIVTEPPPNEAEAVSTFVARGDDYAFESVVFKRQTPVLGIEVTKPDVMVREAHDKAEQMLQKAKDQRPVLPFLLHHDRITEGAGAGLQVSKIELDTSESIEIRTCDQVLHSLVVSTADAGEIAVIMGATSPAPASRPQAMSLRQEDKQAEAEQIRALDLSLTGNFTTDVALIQEADNKRLDKPSWNDHSIAMALNAAQRRNAVRYHRKPVRVDIPASPQVLAIQRFRDRVTQGADLTKTAVFELLYIENERRLGNDSRHDLKDLADVSGVASAPRANFMAFMNQAVDTPATQAIRREVQSNWNPDASVDSVVDQVEEHKWRSGNEAYAGMVRPSIRRRVNKVLLQIDRQRDAEGALDPEP